MTDRILDSLRSLVSLDESVLVNLEDALKSTDVNNIQRQMNLLPPLYAYLTMVQERYKEQLSQMQAALESWEGECYLVFKTQRGGTIREVESQIKSQPEFVRRKEEIAKMTRLVQTFQGILRSLEMKQILLVQQGAYFRREMEMAH